MMNNVTPNTGLFIVVEGTDGAGKKTQAAKLVERLRQAGYRVKAMEFPRYDQPSAYYVKAYLNGLYGGVNEISPYTAALFYALDRFDAKGEISTALSSGMIVVADRFTGSNMAHQGAKFGHPEERRGFFIWLDNLEFEILGVPRPDKSFVLRVEAATAQKLVDKKPARGYTNEKRDIHEADIEHLASSVQVYDDLCQLFPKDFSRIDCVRGGKLLAKDTIAELLWQGVQPLLLPINKLNQGAKMAELPPKNNPYTNRGADGQLQISEAGREYLAEIVTDPEGDVYAFKTNERLGPVAVAAAMARLSRNGNDMRLILLDEFAGDGQAGKDEHLLQRIISEYGDDSVQQLVGLQLVIENASNLLTKQLEWGRLAAYLEQSTRYIYYDRVKADGSYKFHTPDTLESEVKDRYNRDLTAIFKGYSSVVRSLTDYLTSNSKTPKAEQDLAWRSAIRAQACDAARTMLPTATESTVGIFASGQAVESLIMHLKASESAEARARGEQILAESRKVIPMFLERVDLPQKGGAWMAYMSNTRVKMQAFANDSLPETYSKDAEPVTLVKYFPANELSLVPYMLYDSSNLSIEELKDQVDQWPIEQKIDAFKTYMGERLNRRHKPGRALEQAHYTWDIVCDYGIFRDLQRHRMVDDLRWQKLSPRFGYDIPKIIEKAGLSEDYQAAFDISTKLFSHLQAAGHEYEAQYATLLGHKMRWTISMNAREAFHFHELRTSPQGHPGYRKLVQNMHQILSERHPLLGEAMRFINQAEDPELTRLAAERYNQFKRNLPLNNPST